MSLRSSIKSSASSAALGFADPRAAATPANDAIAGDAASPTALARLETAISELKALRVEPMLRRALEYLRAEDARAGSEWALKALRQDPQSGLGWYVLAVAREKAGDFVSSLKAYESALALLPDQSEIANDLGRLAFRMGMKPVAEQLFRRYLEARPDSFEAANNLACAVRDQNRHDEAVEILRVTIRAHPEEALLWNSLATVRSEQCDMAGAVTFFDEALRLDPSFAKARHNRGNAKAALGDLDGALADCEMALAAATAPEERSMMQFARATIQLAKGRIGEGWDDYEARLDPTFTTAMHFLVDRPLWTPGVDLKGKTLLLMGEQGLGDEVLFANLIPDILEALGSGGKLILALEPRLVSLFQRSFPMAEVGAHTTRTIDGHVVRAAPFLNDPDRIDLWAPLASPLRQFRRSVDAFPNREHFLIPDPARIAHWRAALAEAPAGLKVGILWKSMKIDGARARYFSPFQLWAPVLKTPGVSFVNVQYGDCEAELAWAERELGVKFWRPPGIDLKDDLDDIAALTSAMDLTAGFANATSNIAAACGAPAWIVSVPGAWTRLGTDRVPWYPQVRIFLPPAFAAWEAAMADVAAALAEEAAV